MSNGAKGLCYLLSINDHGGSRDPHRLAEVAEPLFRRALELGRDRDPYRRREVLLPRIELGRCLVALGRYAEAEELLLRNAGETDAALDVLRGTRETLRDLYEAWGKPREAAARTGDPSYKGKAR